jgi:hypothetical protein
MLSYKYEGKTLNSSNSVEIKFFLVCMLIKKLFIACKKLYSVLPKDQEIGLLETQLL